MAGDTRHVRGSMAEILLDDVETYIGAIFAILGEIKRPLDPRKISWCNYLVLNSELDELTEKVRKDTRKLGKEIDEELHLSKLWYIGVPYFRLIRRGVAHLTCEIDLYYVARDDIDDWRWYGKITPKADKFEVPLTLVGPLIEGLRQNEIEAGDAKVLEREPGYTIYDYLGREWKIPDAFLGFLWALKEKGMGFEGLLDPISCSLIDRFTVELPAPEAPMLPSGSYEDVVSALRNLGSTKEEAEEAARYVMEQHGNASLEDKVKLALNYSKGSEAKRID